MMVHLSIVPVGDNPHLSKPVAKVLQVIDESGIDYRLTPMGTLLNGEWDDIMKVVKKCHDIVREEHDRVITQIKIDDKENGHSFGQKIQAVESEAGKEFKK